MSVVLTATPENFENVHMRLNVGTSCNIAIICKSLNNAFVIMKSTDFKSFLYLLHLSCKVRQILQSTFSFLYTVCWLICS